MDRQLLNHQCHQHEVGSFQYQHLLDVVNLVGLQNLGELNLDADLTCQVVVHLLLVVPVDVEHRQLRMDYFLGAELQVFSELQVLLALLLLHSLLPLLLLLQLSLHRVKL